MNRTPKPAAGRQVKGYGVRERLAWYRRRLMGEPATLYARRREAFMIAPLDPRPPWRKPRAAVPAGWRDIGATTDGSAFTARPAPPPAAELISRALESGRLTLEGGTPDERAFTRDAFRRRRP